MEGLAWVLVDGVAHHVSTFAHRPPANRPAAICVLCRRRLTLKLGNVRRHHAAHAAGDTCSATHPETALHLNCKLAIAESLRAACGASSVLSIIRRCAGVSGDACEVTSLVEWLHGWDDVIVEHRVGDDRGLRPDIVLSRAGAPAAAIEIVVSNAVSAEKAASLAALDLPWIEVAADQQLAGGGRWTIGAPLPVIRDSTDTDGGWRCPAHAARQRMLIDDAAARRDAEREAARHSTTVRAARVVDIYHAGGARERLIYVLSALATDGRTHSARLRRGGVEVFMTPITSEDDWQSAAWPRIRTAFATDLERFARTDASFTDSPMRWATDDAAQNIVEEALIDRVGRDPTPLARTFPRRWFFAREQARWFLAPDMQGVRWDRQPLDPFAAHPAWAKTRAAVRERPAPEGSWNTPVFASRPIAAMFHRLPDAMMTDESGTMTIVSMDTQGSARRVLVVIERSTTAAAIEQIVMELRDRGDDAIWMSHPMDWNVALSDVAWVLAGRDARGRGGVVVGDLGMFTAEQFVRAVAADDRRLRADAIRNWMASRVARFRSG